MKKLWKSLAIMLCLLAGFGFVFTGCGDDGEDEPSATQLVLTAADTSVPVGSTVKLTAKYGDTDVTSVIASDAWSSSDDSIATVSAGVVTAVAEGSATITASYNNVTATIGITVKKAALKITSDDYTATAFYPTSTATLKAAITDEELDGSDIVWESSDEGVVSLSAKIGESISITGEEIGEAVITARIKDEDNAYATFAVTVTLNHATVELTELPWSVTLPLGMGTESVFTASIDDAGHGTWATGNSEVSYDGLIYCANANGFQYYNTEYGAWFNWYASANTAIGSVAGGRLESYMAVTAKSIASETAKSVKLTITAAPVLKAESEGDSVKIPVLAVYDGESSDGKIVLAQEAFTTESTVPADYVFYVEPGKKIVIGNNGPTASYMVVYAVSAEASDHEVTADGTVAATSVALYDSSYTEITTWTRVIGNSVTVTAKLSPEETTETSVNWESTNSEVASVVADTNDPLKAVVTAKAKGTATITATAATSTVKAELAVDVREASNPIKNLTTSASTLEIDLAGAESKTDNTISATIVPTVVDSACDIEEVEWSVESDYADYLTVSPSVTASEGKVTLTGKLPSGLSQVVTLTAKSGDKTATVSVTVKDSTLLLNETIDWTAIADTVSTAATYAKNESIILYAQSNGFQGDKLNYWAVSAYAGDTVSSGIKSYFQIEGTALANTDGNVKLVVNAQAKQGSPILGVYDPSENSKKVIAHKELGSNGAAALDCEFVIAAGKTVQLITLGGTGNLSIALNSIKAYKTSATLDTAAPAAPTIGTATAIALGGTVSWTAPSDTDVGSYVVYYCDSENGTYTAGTTANASATSATVSGLTAQKQYYFKVAARDVYGNESAQSAATNCTTLAATAEAGKTYTWNFVSDTTKTGTIVENMFTSTDGLVTCTASQFNHGLQLAGSCTMTVKVAGNVKLTFTGCTYDGDQNNDQNGPLFTVKNGETVVQGATLTYTPSKAEGEGTYGCSYTGDATTLTITWTAPTTGLTENGAGKAQAYIHALTVEPIE